METILIMAHALENARSQTIVRLDIQYNDKTEDYTGYVYFAGDLGGSATYRVTDSGEVTKLNGGKKA